MTVKELVEALAQHDPDSHVHVAIVEFGKQRAGKWANPIEGISKGEFNTVCLHRPTHGGLIGVEELR